MGRTESGGRTSKSSSVKNNLLALAVLLALIVGVTALSSRRGVSPRLSASNSSRPASSSRFDPADPLPLITVRGVRLGMSEEEVSQTLQCQPFRRFPSKDPNRYSRTWGINQVWELGCTFTNGHLTDMGGFGSDFTVGSKTFRYKSELSELDRDLGPADTRMSGDWRQHDRGWVRYPRSNLHVSYLDGKVTGLQTYVRARSTRT